MSTQAPQITYSKLADLQTPFDAAVVMPTILRGHIYRALESAFKQEDVARVQILIGIDKANSEDISRLYAFLEDIPDHVAITVLNPGYSTSQRHGGQHKAYDGGALRTILSFLANSPYLTYLDDDNWWEVDHIKSLKSVIHNHAWAFSHRNFRHQGTLDFLYQDNIESVGPGKGIYSTKAGGFVDPNCLMIDKTKADAVLQIWSTYMDGDRTRLSSDRLIFDKLRHVSYGDTQKATANYVIDPNDAVHPYRLKYMPEAIRQKYYPCS